MYNKVEGDAEKAYRLTAAILERVNDVTVAKAGKQKSVTILDIDATTTEAEILSAVAHSIRSPSANTEEMSIKSIKTNRAGYRYATVVTTGRVAETLIRMGRIKIGWLSCRVREREEVKTCYRCLEAGHEAAACREADRSRCRLKCGEEGHKVKECTNEERCTKCGEEGHRIHSSRCPTFAAYRREIGEGGRREGRRQ